MYFVFVLVNYIKKKKDKNKRYLLKYKWFLFWFWLVNNDVFGLIMFSLFLYGGYFLIYL